METEAILVYRSQEAALPRPQAPQHTIGRVAGNKVSEMLCFRPKHTAKIRWDPSCGLWKVVKSVHDKTHSISNKGMHKDIMTNLYFTHTQQAHAIHTYMQKHS